MIEAIQAISLWCGLALGHRGVPDKHCLKRLTECIYEDPKLQAYKHGDHISFGSYMNNITVRFDECIYKELKK